jgi:hypothetical protein
VTAPPIRPTPALRPGLHVVRRDDHHLQVGVDPPWRVVLPDEPGVRRLLGALSRGRPAVPETDAEHRALAALARAGVLDERRPGPRPRTVAVRATGDVADEVALLLHAAGCEIGDGPVALVLAPGEVARADADVHLRDGRPHLVVGAGPAGWTLGPFVVPGQGACLRCVDAHRGERDPRRALVVEQLAGLPAAPDDPALTTLALAWAVRDLLTHLDGGQPSTWSATIDVGPDLLVQRHAWARHPHCGCSWA